MEIIFYFFVFLPFWRNSAADRSFLHGPDIQFIEISFFENGKKWTGVRGLKYRKSSCSYSIQMESLRKEEKHGRRSDKFRHETQMEKGK